MHTLTGWGQNWNDSVIETIFWTDDHQISTCASGVMTYTFFTEVRATPKWGDRNVHVYVPYCTLRTLNVGKVWINEGKVCVKFL